MQHKVTQDHEWRCPTASLMFWLLCRNASARMLLLSVGQVCSECQHRHRIGKEHGLARIAMQFAMHFWSCMHCRLTVLYAVISLHVWEWKESYHWSTLKANTAMQKEPIWPLADNKYLEVEYRATKVHEQSDPCIPWHERASCPVPCASTSGSRWGQRRCRLTAVHYSSTHNHGEKTKLS